MAADVGYALPELLFFQYSEVDPVTMPNFLRWKWFGWKGLGIIFGFGGLTGFGRCVGHLGVCG